MSHSPFRRALLKGLGLSGAALLMSSSIAHTARQTKDNRPFPDHFYDTVPAFGIHQAGIITPEPKESIFMAFNLLVKTRDELDTLFQKLSKRIAYLTVPQTLDHDDDRQFPPKESGLLGGQLLPDQLTITLSVGSSLFDDRFGLAPLKPKHLIAMSNFPNDRLDPKWCGGDLVLQLCANSKEILIYALRDIMKHHYHEMAPLWKMDGFLPARDIETQSTPINLFGFKDGTGNAPSNDAALMNDIVWVTEKNKEPAWCLNGSYQAIRLIRFNLEFWDRTPLEDQENDFGRIKHSGAPIGMMHEHDDPQFALDPHGDRVLFDSHMRRAEPRVPHRYSAPLRRRSYSYSLGLTDSGLLDMGLIFVSYQNDLNQGFIKTQKRLNGEPLERYIEPFGGGYFFALPGMNNPNEYLGQSLFVAAKQL
ncbi:iron uptake transporter deferrochelatase/peroxidase subunit [Wohlfahrtiimonas chitiniclastica]|uniref:iron uptake transporter deferrochelatase/peroxidase subunit n=1 Tax=Wohlfahrtiimonas chitiniclastica TaxID=400946 RepID=UPI000B992421|nr:iron uptake transporter deferrochelatase/peroxidase subunit [Wohlfahrtiimonas chitiniclastica]OYQ85208.1 deferrochelatase/peroxidase EfeB [Wohlfahrtiimonas chitiniclastica]OYQ86559.1 deferrochelatase/peroxidase EfeB [Wohlfahrtiimonas chitiniclastica]